MNIQEKIEVLIKEKRKSRKDLAEVLFVTYNGLTHKMKYDTFKGYEIEKLEAFFEVEKGYFDKEPQAEVKSEPTMWELAREQYERRVEELSAALSDARYTIQLQRKMLEQNPFKFVSKKPPVKIINYSFMYVSHISPTPILNIG